MSHTGIVFNHCWVWHIHFIWRRILMYSIFWDRLAVIIQSCITCNILCSLYLPPSPSPPFTDLIIVLLKGFSFSSPSHLLSLRSHIYYCTPFHVLTCVWSPVCFMSCYEFDFSYGCSGRNLTPPCSQVCLFSLNMLTGYFIIKQHVQLILVIMSGIDLSHKLHAEQILHLI